MKIIDRNKDFYDFLAHQTNSDEDIVFDRRGSILLTKDILCKTINEGSGSSIIVNGKTFLNPIPPDNSFSLIFKDKKPEPPFYITILTAGFTFFIIKWTHLKYENSSSNHFYNSSLIDFKMELLCTVKWYDYSGPPLCLYRAHSRQYSIAKMTKDDWLKANFANITFCPFFKNQPDKVFPILNNAGFASIIQPEEIYMGIEEYLLALKNDKPAESFGLTDVDKIVNHGFDKKTSFRNVKN